MGLYTHYYRIDVPYQAKREFYHRQIYAGDALAPVQYRILPVLITAGLRQMFSVPIIMGYWGQRLFFSFLAILGLHYYLRKWFPIIWAAFGVVTVIALMPFTYLWYGIQPADPIVFFCYVAGLILIREKRDNWLLLLLLIGMTAKETVGLLALAYFFARFELRWNWRFVVYCFLYAAIILGVYFGLRVYYGARPNYVQLITWNKNFADLPATMRTLTILPLFFSSYLLGFFYLKAVPTFLKRVLIVVPIYVLIHLFLGLMREARLFLPLTPFIIPIGLFYLQDRWHSSTT